MNIQFIYLFIHSFDKPFKSMKALFYWIKQTDQKISIIKKFFLFFLENQMIFKESFLFQNKI